METEECYDCGGMGGVEAGSFGDTGWHACYKCLATGQLPKGSRDADAAQEKESADRGQFRESAFSRDCGDRYDGDWEAPEVGEARSVACAEAGRAATRKSIDETGVPF